MKVELAISRTDGNVGDIVEVSNAEAQRLFDSGCAVPVRSVKKEKATKSAKREKAYKK